MEIKRRSSFGRCSGVGLVLLLCASCSGVPTEDQQRDADARILQRMADQEAAWNEGDLEGFMAAYWKSDSLLFVGSKGPTRGWATTLENYQTSYPNRKAMGTLDFDIKSIDHPSPGWALVLGSWRLENRGELPPLDGWFTLVWNHIDGDWVIVQDHSS